MNLVPVDLEKNIKSAVGNKVHLFLLSVFSAILLLFSFPQPSLFPLAWIALIPLLYTVVEAKNSKQILFFSFIQSLIFWSFQIYWVGYVSVLGCIGLVLVLSIYATPIGWLSYFIRQRLGLSFIWTFPLIWTSFEWMRTHLFTGFPWALLGTSQHLFSPLIQISEWTGVYGVSFLVVLANASLFEWLLYFQKKRKPLSLFEKGIAPLLIFISIAYGFTYLQTDRPATTAQKLKLSLIQGNIPQDVKWDPSYEKYIQEEYEELTFKAFEADDPDLILWPETAIPSYLRYDDSSLDYLAQIVKKTKKTFLVGTSDALQKNIEEEGKLKSFIQYYNTAFLVEPEKGLTQQYNKIHLVPFGEYLPKPFTWLHQLVPLEENYSFGQEYKVFDFTPPFSVVICFEDIFPDLVRQFTKNGAQWLVNLTNDGWFQNSSAPMQHTASSIFRCIENRVWMVRCTNTGVSCFIDPTGKIVKQVEDKEGKNIWLKGFVTHSIEPSSEKTFYTLYGNVFSLLIIGILIVILLLALKGKKNGLKKER